MQDQSQWNIYQENHEIEQIWYSSRKISDKMQVRDKQGGGLHIVWQWNSRYGKNDDPHSVPAQITSLTIDTTWITEYREYNWDIRIPLAWAYLVTWYMRWWTSSATNTKRIAVNWKKMVSVDSMSPTDKVEVYQILNLWKYDIFTLWTQTTSYSWSGSWITTTWYFDIYLTKL